MLTHDDPAPLFLKRPHRSVSTAGQWFWTEDEQFDIEYHVRHSALPKPGRIRELLELCGRLHSTRLALERPLWEVHVIEGLRDGRVAMYTKMHHALIDGVSSMRLLQSVLSTDPDERGHGADLVRRSTSSRRPRGPADEPRRRPRSTLPLGALRAALAISAEAAGLPGALVRTLARGRAQRDLGALALRPPHDLNKQITGSRRFAAEDWPIERIRAIGKASGTTSTTWCSRCAAARCGRYLERARRAARRLAGRDGPGRPARRRTPRAPRPRAATPSAR